MKMTCNWLPRKVNLSYARIAWLLQIVAIAVIAVNSMAVRAYEVFQGPTELIQYDPAKAFVGYTLFSPFRGRFTYLIDMHGNVVHRWPYPEGWRVERGTAIEKHARLLEDGTLLRGVIDAAGKGPQSGAIYQLLNWEGEVIWEHDEERPGYTPHHDFRMIWNPKLQARTLLYITSRKMTDDVLLSLGADPTNRRPNTAASEGVVEVDMDGNIVWEWYITDHLVQDYDAERANYGVVGENPGKMDPNFANGTDTTLMRTNAIDYNEVLDQLIVNNSAYSEFYVIDHGSTFVPGDPKKSIDLAASDLGDIIYRWGNPCAYDAGECPHSINEGQSSVDGHQQTFFSHDVQWIKEREVTPYRGELPGAGNILLFDNGTRRLGPTYSRVLEINPYQGSMPEGVYVQEMLAGHEQSESTFGGNGAASNISKQIAWSFSSVLPNALYSTYISGVQRLPNGNTLVCSGAHGHFFEVTPDGEIVWEYINPVGDTYGDKYGIYSIMTDKVGIFFNATFRCVRYPTDYSAFKDKDLTPMGKITGLYTREPVSPNDLP